MRKVLFIAALILGLSHITTAQKVAVVDVNEILESLPEFQDAQRALDKASASWRQEIAQEYDKIKSMYNKYQAEQVLLSDNERQEREDAIVQKEAQVRELQKEKFGPEGALFEKRRELVSPVQDKVFNAIESYASDRGYDIILDKAGSAGVLFISEEFDKTDAIKKRLGIR